MTPPTHMLRAVHFENVAKDYEGASGKSTSALRNVSFTAFEHEILAIVGPSGCGKSTLLKLATGELIPSAGEIEIELRSPRFASVSQNDNLFDWMKVGENLSYGMPDLKSVAEQVVGDRVKRYLAVLGLKGFENSWPRELSAGMRKRLELGRAYASDPDILVLDEAFGSLDYFTKEDMQMFLLKVWQEQPKTILFVTHDPEEAVFLGSRVLVLSPRPGTVRKIIEVPFGPVRTPEMKLTKTFLDVREDVLSTLGTMHRMEL